MLVSEIIRKTANQKQPENPSSKTTSDVNKLLQKFSNLSANIRKSSKQKNARIEEKLKQLEKDLEDHGKEDQISQLNTRLASLLTHLEELAEETQKTQSLTTQRARNSHENFASQVEDLRQMSREILGGFNKESEKQIFGVELMIKKSQKIFNEQMNHYELGINESIEFLEKEAERELGDREVRAREIESEILGYLDIIEEDIGVERELREQTEFKVRELIEQLDRELVEKIVCEKKEREKSNNSLLNLLEQACCKLEKNFSQY